MKFRVGILSIILLAFSVTSSLAYDPVLDGFTVTSDGWHKLGKTIEFTYNGSGYFSIACGNDTTGGYNLNGAWLDTSCQDGVCFYDNDSTIWQGPASWSGTYKLDCLNNTLTVNSSVVTNSHSPYVDSGFDYVVIYNGTDIDNISNVTVTSGVAPTIEPTSVPVPISAVSSVSTDFKNSGISTIVTILPIVGVLLAVLIIIPLGIKFFKSIALGSSYKNSKKSYKK